MSLYRGPGGSGDATNDASSQAVLATAAANAAEVSKNQAQASASAASTSATNASNSATAAASSASSAAASVSSIGTSVSDAATSASNASTSATNAASSASSASTSATNASNSASSASTSASNASTSASNAATSATNASNSATTASTAATNAGTSETNAAASASTASTAATNASNSASSASTSASIASSSASSASSSASTATTQASNASTSATNASNSASAASTSATNASNSASTASTAATNASAAQVAAETARDQTLTAYDNFDDRYLGAKTSDPTLDNDGNALLAGALYFNSSLGYMKVYTGSVWVDAYAAGTSFLAKANNLSDLPDASVARTNLGLAIGTNVQAYDADLATIAGLTPTNNYAIIGNGTSWTSSALPATGVTSVTGTAPIVSSGGTTPAISIPAATSSVNGYLTSTDWSTFNAKQGAITLTTTGSSGAATLIGTTLNIPNYSGALTGYVPYTGATGNVDLGEFGISSGYFQADLTPSGSLQVGRMQWNSSDGTMDLRLMGNNVTLQIGQEQVARVVNGTGGNLLESNYQAVKIIGAQGQRLAVAYAQANNDANSADTIGLVTETIATNQEGFIMAVGQLENINTTGSLQGETWVDGDVLYLSPFTPGAITKVKPTGNGHSVVIGYVEYAHVNNGKIFVKVMNGWELDELHDVAIVSPANNEALIYESSTSLWKNKTIASALSVTLD